MKKNILSFIVLLMLANSVMANDYIIKELPVNSPDLDAVSDTYQITVARNNFKIENSLDKKQIKNKIINYCKEHQTFIIATLEIFAYLFCPILVPALQEAATMQDDDNSIHQGETTVILVPAGTKPILIKEN